MTIALKILAFISACGIAMFDFSKFQIIAENPYYFDQIISYYFLPAGLLLSLFYFTGLLENKIFKKITAVLLMIFASLHGALKLADLILNVASKTIDNYENTYQCFIWISQLILLASFFILGSSFFKNKLQKVAAYILIASIIPYILSYAYYIYFGGYSLSQIVDTQSDIFFIVPQIFVLIGYVGIYFKEVWMENDLL